MDSQNTDQNKEIKTSPIINKTNKDCKNNGLLALIGLLIIVSAVGWYLYFDMRSTNIGTVTQLNVVSDEKEEVTNELKELIVQYEDLKTDNEDLNSKLSQEQQHIETLLEELKKVKADNRWQIHKYKKELSTLREIMKNYIYQIDSLNTLNVNLRQENQTVSAENQRISSKNKELEELTTNLSTTVEKASVLRAINIVPMALKSKGKETNRSNKVEKIRVCFTITENAVAKSGPQMVYLRILNPQNAVLSGNINTVNFGETVISYSDKREIEYDNKDLDVCIYWAKSENLPEGEYKVELISEGNLIGTSAFYLK
ncbi:MAG: hypothetical protein JXR60_07585 [Bacteroidales bacterium]|nr:hypothetical protein [Bacteroidales bacterium]